MSESRTVQILATSVDISIVREEVGFKEFNNAIGYLSTWNMTYPKVVIFIDSKELEIQASYRDENDQPKYFICGVWQDDQYSFHS